MMEGKTYRNIPGGGELDEPAFYGRLRKGVMSTTTQVNSEEFLSEFTPILEAGEDGTLCWKLLNDLSHLPEELRRPPLKYSFQTEAV